MQPRIQVMVTSFENTMISPLDDRFRCLSATGGKKAHQGGSELASRQDETYYHSIRTSVPLGPALLLCYFLINKKETQKHNTINAVTMLLLLLK